MTILLTEDIPVIAKIKPVCPVFGKCGGCAYQDISYEQELSLKETRLKELLAGRFSLDQNVFHPIVASPHSWHYRSRLDLTFKRFRKTGLTLLGFRSAHEKTVIPVEACPIARPEISDFLPELKREAQEKMPLNYDFANLTVRTDDSGRVRWGGIGRKSTRLAEEEYFWTEIEGKKIFYSLDTFFQANLSILPLVVKEMRELVPFGKQTVFLDLYSGVGLFGILMAGHVGKVFMVEDSKPSAVLARFNAAFHRLTNAEIICQRVEDALPGLLTDNESFEMAAVVDPPRAGLSGQALHALAGAKSLGALLYLSCNPEALCRDLLAFSCKGWRVLAVIPFDFFPKTSHLETLVLLEP